MTKFLSKQWYDIGGFLSLITLFFLFFNRHSLTDYQLIVWLSLTTLFLHQLEEYRIVGTFPGMVNTVMYNSKNPDRFPLNAKTALYINVYVGWSFYMAAAVLAENAIWLGLATILVSIGNTLGHTFLFNIKGRTFYNAGLATCWLCFVPITYFFLKICIQQNLFSIFDFLVGLPLGIALNYFGILKLIDWMSDQNTEFVFPKRNLLNKN